MRGSLVAVLAGSLVAASAGAQEAPKAAKSDKLEAAADNISRMRSSLKHVLARAEDARSEKDIVKLSCVNEKLTQIKSLLKVAEQADISLHEAVAAKDQGGDAEFSKIAIARTKVDGLRADSEQCLGQVVYMVDEKTTVEVEQPGSAPAASGPGVGLTGREFNPVERRRSEGAWELSMPASARPPAPVAP